MWTRTAAATDNSGIYAQRYAANGAPQGTEFQISAPNDNIRRDPSIAIDADGDFVVAWISFQAGFDVRARRYAANGMPQGTEFRVNTTTVLDQFDPSIALGANGEFVVAWEGVGQDGSFSGIYAQRYAADGMPQGDEFQVNTTTNGRQIEPAVALDADGDFTIAWKSDGQGGSSFEIYAQRFEGKPADSDGDSILDSADNCTLKPNPDQSDSNGDGFGNVCDADLNGDGVVNTADLALMRQRFYSFFETDADLNGDGTVNFADLAILKSFFFQPPGPSAVVAP